MLLSTPVGAIREMFQKKGTGEWGKVNRRGKKNKREEEKEREEGKKKTQKGFTKDEAENAERLCALFSTLLITGSC